MPNPKDPEKLAAYREKQRQNALAGGFGKWMLGKKSKPSTIEKLRKANVGKIISVEHREALSRARARELAEGKPLFGGLEKSAQRCIATGLARKGKTYEEIYGPERAQAERLKRKVGNDLRFVGHVNKPIRTQRDCRSFEYREWRTSVFKRDNYTCRRCNIRGGKLHAHHIQKWADTPELRFESSNGLTLCMECHKKEHEAD